VTLFRRTAGIGVAALTMAALAACGTVEENATTDGQTGFQAYVACLQQNGVAITMPSFGLRGSRSPGAFPSRDPAATPPSGSGPDFGDGGPGPRGGGGPGAGGGGFGGMSDDPDNPPAGVDQATWAKALTACQSVRPTAGPRGGNDSALTAYRNCLAEQGVSTSGPVNTTDPKVAAAREACAALLPTNRPAAPPSSPSA
jgi:hypothetical protein